MNILKLTICLMICAATAVHGQTYIRTNLQVAATITNSTTYTYAGTNFVDASRYGEVAFEVNNTGNAAGTNNVVWTFRLSADGTNWATSPTYTWVTGPGYSLTNWTLGPIGYIQPYQRVSTNSENMTNTMYGVLKGYRRD